MEKQAFITSDIARMCRCSRETVKRWLEKGEIKGFRVGASGHWRVLPKDLASFLKYNDIPFPEPSEVGIDLQALSDSDRSPTFCWEFYKDKMNEHVSPDGRCEDCLVYKTKSINCYALRKEVGHKMIHCRYSCDDCEYFHFQQEVVEPAI